MKILASDYDGTLRTEELVDINDVHAIHEFRAAGNMFGLVTGRSMESLQTEIQKNKIEFDFIVANNGGVIYDRDFQRLQVLYMDSQQGAGYHRIYQNPGLCIVCYQ